ncbi:M14 family metallopeptidase [Ferruginibacter paludis]|uniref:M14 metallopeptidase family protein n=1 Tax=Ferruginibacter paludis TaxID=1310417 RepID=UPI0025B453E0|nr:M14 metallopeptidase family protein [Ferruginibacter paludis]MDN3655111.1 M14 family metallopeptidase [Ferruginibacter paludis]
MDKKIVLILFFACIVFCSFAQTIKSPDEFLGYPLGSKYTPHYKIVNYFKYAVAAMPQVMKLDQYGETNEGRPLLLAYIATPENLAKLDDIRKNNLRLTGMLTDQQGNVNAPVIVWLSYNVHGNETSSSEASMKTLYELLNPANNATKEWLKNTVVLIDPCINPDGRDRYVNWYNSVVGKNANPDKQSREHMEPWPGGRTNHYNFDLNRDWAWQTQKETQQRLKMYNQWMPQVHVDYHEQGYNNPYYFAPAAQPYHEVVTQWQRDFQVTIGKNNAKYFDSNGWLYFTKEEFDLFYPSYGDTYPIYSGAIGMTFEQGGGSRSGSAVIIDNGDTLTLKDRIAHHFTTGMSTLEMASQNKEKLMKEFSNFFINEKNNGIGEYKSFVVTDVNSNKINALKRMLDGNNILYSNAVINNAKGFNYFSGKEESFSAANSLVVSTYQPKGTLVKVLFEPKSKLVDSATYDITAWSLPYVFGLQAYAVKEKITITPYGAKQTTAAVPETSYGYLVNYTSFEEAKFLAALLNAGIRVRFAEKDFMLNDKKFMRGTLIVLKKGNETKLADFAVAAQKFNANVTAISTGFMESGNDFGSAKTHFINQPKVALVTGKGTDAGAAGELWHLFEQELDYPLTLINADDFTNLSLKNIDVIILPNGNYKFLSDKEPLADLKTWVRQGGKIIALENAVNQMANGDWGLKVKKEDEEKDKKDEPKVSYADVKPYEENEHEYIKNTIAGAIYKLDIDNTHPLAFGYPNYYFTLKQDDKMYEFLKEGWNVGIIKKDSKVAGFAGSKVKDKIKDGTAIGVQEYGQGSIVYFSDDPVFRCFWENGKLMLSNAVFFVGQ